MKLLKTVILSIPLLGFFLPGFGQSPVESDLFEILRQKDSVLFHAAFNSCDPLTMASLFTEDFEFYHDRSGASSGRSTFLSPMYERCTDKKEDWIQPSRRILIANTLKVYPLKNNGELYGAIQEGMHRFEFLNEDQQYQKGDIARFIHLWIIEEGEWKIKRELSYDHQPAGSYQINDLSQH